MSGPGLRDERLALYRNALARSNQLIEPTAPSMDMSLAAVQARASMRLEHLARFLATIGNPHLHAPVVHVTGTSGKGSTSAAIASILEAAGYRVGLYTSPYLQSATEKLQIDGRLIDPVQFSELVDAVLAAASEWSDEPLSYAEFWFALASLAFATSEVDFAVVEVGAGGRFDVTNLVQPAVSVITSIGLDHTETLGSTIGDIAWHKAGIVKAGVPVVTGAVDPVALGIIRAEAALKESRVVKIVEGEAFTIVSDGLDGVCWTDPNGARFQPGMLGRFQASNAALAVAAVRELKDVVVSDDMLHGGLKSARLPGRFEIVQRDSLVMLDGAHNPEKIAALADELPRILGPDASGRLIAVVGALAAKDHRAIVGAIAGAADALILTSPRVLAKPPAEAKELAEDARNAGFWGEIEVLSNPHEALDLALRLAGRSDAVLVTGSLYLVGNVRGRWFPDEEIVLQQTSWPVAPD